MYKGNMEDFVNRVSEYLNKQYDSRIIFGRIQYPDHDGYYVAFFAGNQASAVGYTVFDSDNFEQQIYDFVNSELEEISYVQGEHEGLFKQSDGISREDIPEANSEDF